MLATGCNGFGGPDIAGRVAEVRGEEVLVVLDNEHPDIGDDARVSLRTIGEPPEIDVGDRVRIWLEPGREDSDPPGVSATRVEVTTD